MGTRSLTFVYEETGDGQKEPILNLYRQFDGYPTGHGAELAEFLNSGTMTNGLRTGDTGRFFNGINCLAAQLVSNFKTESGNFYLYPTSATDCGQDYEYHISEKKNGLYVEVYYCGCNLFGLSQSDKHELIFQGYLEEFTEFCKEKETA